jgi:hypothetical protein
MRKRLGELLLERRLIDVDQLNAALGHQRQWGMRLGTALVAKGFIAEGTLMRVLSESLSIPIVDLAKIEVDPNALAVVPARICEQYEVFPISVKEPKGGRRILLLAMADPLNVTAIDEIAFTTSCMVKPAIAQVSSLDQAIQRYYHGKKIDISPLNFDRGALGRPSAFPGVGGPGDTEPPTTSPSMRQPFMDYSDEGEPAPVVMGISLVDNKALPPDDPYAGQPTGAFAIAKSDEAGPDVPLVLENVARPADQDAIEALEKKFWALMRVLARRGLVTKDEFFNELGETEK